MLITLGISLVLLTIIAISIGGNGGIKNIFKLLGNLFGMHNEVSGLDKTVLLDLRLPRIIMDILVGIALSLAGLLMQGVFQNPLVSPYTLGISNGAAFGAALCMVLGGNLTFLGQYALPISAFIGALVTIILVYFIWKATGKGNGSIILVGMSIGYLFSAMLSFLQYTGSRNALPKIVFWMMGSIANVSWIAVIIMAMVDIIGIVVVISFAWDFNIMEYGRDIAISLGVDYDKIRNLAIVIATILTATAVAFTGIIGFVGLMAPQVVRILLGRDYRYTGIGAILFGGILVLLSDTIARTIMYPVDLPIGIITSFVGVPFFLYLVIKRR
ncbi:MAG: FecCD family ABC transporter permease [Clostridium sp.]